MDNYDESDYMESEFYREEHIEYAALRNRLKPGAVPSLFLDNGKEKLIICCFILYKLFNY